MNKYLYDGLRGMANGIAPLNASKKIDAQFLPNYTEVDYVASDTAASLMGKQTFVTEQTFNYDDYNIVLYDNLNGVAAGFKSGRGLFNQLFVDDIVFTRADNTNKSGMNEGISFYIWDDVDSQIAIKDTQGNITTEGYNKLIGYKKIASILNDGSLVLKSPSDKYFKISVNDNGELSTSEYVFKEQERYEV